MAGSNEALPKIGSTFGWFLIASIVSCLLFGASCIQFFNYCDIFWKKDKWPLKMTVLLAMTVDLVHLIFLLLPTYRYLVTDFGNFAALEVNSSELQTETILTGFSVAIAQGLFVHRVYTLSEGNKIWTSVLVFLVICEFASICIYYNSVLQAKVFEQLSSKSATTNEMAWLSVTLVTDLSLALSLVYLLQRRREGDFSKTDSILKTIIAYTIGTTLLTTLCFIIALILVNVYPTSFASLAFDLLVCKLYVNCMFVSLNARNSLQRRMRRQSNVASIPLSNLATMDTEIEFERSRKFAFASSSSDSQV